MFKTKRNTRRIKIFVAGSLSSPIGLRKILKLQDKLRKAGFKVIDQFKSFNYVKVKDFRSKIKLAKKIVKHDISLIKKSNLVIVFADEPSFGTGAEVFYAKQILRNKVIAIATRKVKSPWIVAHADLVLKSSNFENIVATVKEIYS